MATAEIQRLLPRHFKIMDLMLAGIKQVSIASMVGVTPQMVGVVVRSPIFKKEFQRKLVLQNGESHNRVQKEMDSFAGKARSIIDCNSEKAAMTQVDLLDAEDDSVRLRASTSILDRALGKIEAATNASSTSVKVEIHTKDAQLLILALTESKEISNARENESAANGQDAYSPEDGERDVYQASQSSPRLGHRETEAQASEEVKEEVSNGTSTTGWSSSSYIPFTNDIQQENQEANQEAEGSEDDQEG